MGIRFLNHTSQFYTFRMDISSFNRVRLDSTWQSEEFVSGFNRLYIVREGHAYFFVNGKRLELLPGHVYLIPAGVRCSYSCDDFLEKIYLHFNLFDRYQNEMTRSLNRAIIQESDVLFDHFEALFAVNDPMRTMKLNELLLSIVTKIEDFSVMEPEHTPLIQDTLEYIGQNFLSHPDVVQISAAMAVSPSKLTKQFRKEMQIPLIKYVNRRLLSEAEHLLRTTALSVEDIALACGYTDPFYFSRIFTSYYHYSPQKYRKIVRN